jgi:hypothetical protein
MRMFLLASGTAVLLLILFGGVLVHKGDALSATACAEGLPQGPGTRCTRLTVDKHKPKKEKNHGEQAQPGTRCSRLSNGTYKRGSMLPNTPPGVELKASVDKITLSCKGGETPTVCSTDAKVQLKSIASDADGDTLLYTYSVTGGRMSGDGSEVAWDLSGVEAGIYNISVEVDDGCGCISWANATVSVVACPDCKP